MNCKQSYSQIVSDVSREQIWAIWSDIDRRSDWDSDTEWAKLQGDFEEGARFYFKVKGGPKLKMTITECTLNCSFTDCFTMVFGKLYGIHEMKSVANGLEIKTTIVVEGVLRKLWYRLIDC